MTRRLHSLGIAGLLGICLLWVGTAFAASLPDFQLESRLTKPEAPLAATGERALDERLGQRVHGTGGLVHDKDVGLGQHRPRQADELLLSHREQITALTASGRAPIRPKALATIKTSALIGCPF